MTSTLDGDLSHDAFLGGRLHLWQPKAGYRAGVDPVLLAASVPAKAGQSVLDLGCGVGTAALCLGARVPGLGLVGVERQADYAALAARNGLETFCADLTDMPDALKAAFLIMFWQTRRFLTAAQGPQQQTRGERLDVGRRPPWRAGLMQRPGGWHTRDICT